MKEKNLRVRTVIFESNGKSYHGTYTVDRDLLTVTFGMATKSDLLSGTPHEALAVLLLSELVNASKKGF